MSTAAHAFLAPSSAHRWVHCALAPSLEAAHPEGEESPAALEGTAAHWVAGEVLAGRPPLEGSQAPNGVGVTREMLEGGALAQQAIGHLGAALRIEAPVTMRNIHPVHNFGTPDYRAWATERELWVVDYKFGHGIVEVFENWQTIDYVEGCLEERGVDGLDDQQITVVLGIIQPRAYHPDGPVRWWRVRASDLRGYFNQLRAAAERATGPDPKGTPTEAGCEHCRGRHACGALQRAAYEAAAHSAKWGAVTLSDEAAGVELRLLRTAAANLAARISGLEAQVVAALKAGKALPTWTLESVPARLAWTRPLPEVFALGDMLGLDLRRPVDAITPTQALALAKSNKLPAELLEPYANRPPGAVKLTENKGTKAALIFGGGML